MNRRALMTGGLAAAAALGGAGLAWWHRRGSGGGESSAATEALWGMSFDAPQGTPLQLVSFRGRPLIINFWATWCPPCVKEMPQIDRFYLEFRSQGWQVVGLAVDKEEPVREFLRKLPVSFPIGLANFAGLEVSKSLGNAAGGLPFTVAFNSQGQLVQRKLGETSYEELVSWAQPRA